ncbi:MAG: mannonate dehydratase [Pseudomonadota bacterium]
MTIRVAVGQFKHITDEDLSFAAQIGVSGITFNQPDFDTPQWRTTLGRHGPDPGADTTPPPYFAFMDLVRLRTMIESYGLKLEAIENVPGRYMDKIKLGLPGRDVQIENYKTLIRNLGAAGIPVLGYNFNLTRVWRTNRAEPGRGGARNTAFDLDLATRAPNIYAERITAEQVWDNYRYFIEAVLPEAERSGVRMALHPDDPPVPELGGVARVMINLDGFKRAMMFGDSDAHGLDFCMGTWSEGGIETMFEAMEHFGRQKKLVYLHFRNVKGCLPTFTEAFIDEGDIDVVRAIRLLRDVDFDGFIIDDHVPVMAGDSPWGHRGRAYSTGFIKGLVRAIEAG